LEALHALTLPVPVLNLGFDDAFTAHGDPAVLLAQQGLTAPGIQAAIEDKWPDLTGHAATLVPFRKAS
jgi:deoxyxylulose-5-phosphate synthase